jgi:multicomponent Na+:H+ antiporter subunit E
MSQASISRARRLADFLLWLFGLGLLWWVLTDGAVDSWGIGLPVVALGAIWRAAAGYDGPHLHPIGVLRFLPFFAWYSLRGGIDVARRALHPDMPLAPVVAEWPARLPPGPARSLFLSVTGLLPGTLGVEWEGERFQIHVLDRHGAFAQDLQRLEAQIAGLFGLAWPESGGHTQRARPTSSAPSGLSFGKIRLSFGRKAKRPTGNEVR